MKQILNCLVRLLIVIRNPAKFRDQECMSYRGEKNDGRDKVQRLLLNPTRKLSDKGRNPLVMVTIEWQRKNRASIYKPEIRGCKSSQTQRDSENKERQTSTHGTLTLYRNRSVEHLESGALRRLVRLLHFLGADAYARKPQDA
jgi:hypothetical protein